MDRELLEYLERRFSSIDERFTSIDERFTSIDERFTSIDERFTSIDERFTSLEERFEKRFTSIDERFTSLDERFEKRFTSLEERLEEGLRQTRVLVEDLRADVELVAEGVVNVDEKLERHREETRQGFGDVRELLGASYRELERRADAGEERDAALDRRVTTLERRAS